MDLERALGLIRVRDEDALRDLDGETRRIEARGDVSGLHLPDKIRLSKLQRGDIDGKPDFGKLRAFVDSRLEYLKTEPVDEAGLFGDADSCRFYTQTFAICFVVAKLKCPISANSEGHCIVCTVIRAVTDQRRWLAKQGRRHQYRYKMMMAKCTPAPSESHLRFLNSWVSEEMSGGDFRAQSRRTYATSGQSN